MRPFASRRGASGWIRSLAFSLASLLGLAGLPAAAGTTAALALLDVNESPSAPVRQGRISIVGEWVVFAGRTEGRGLELYGSDGSPGGTRLLADIWPGPTGSRPSAVVALGDVGYFSASDPEHGRELWRTDGTPEGTWRVEDIVPGEVGSDARDFVAVAGEIYFRAWSAGTGMELWRTDGTAEGTRLVADVRPGVEESSIVSITPLGGRALFFADDGTHGSEPWVTDGTSAGTRLLRDVRSGAEGSDGSFHHGEMQLGRPTRGAAYFTADDGIHGLELWKTDGTERGTALVADLNPGPDPSYASPVLDYRGELILTARTPTQRAFATDGTPQGTRELPEGVPVGNPAIVFQDEIWSSERGEGSATLWATDGTPGGSRRMATISTTDCGSEYFNSLTVAGERLFFVSHQTGRKWQIWSFDGARSATEPAPDELGPIFDEIRGLTVLGDEILYLASSSDRRRAIWRSDGTEAGTEPFAGMLEGNASSLQSGDMVALGDVVYFFADSGQGQRLYRSDGTPEGTESVPSFDSLGAPTLWSDSAVPLIAASDSFYVRSSQDIWRSDGTHRGLEHVLYLDDAYPPTAMVVLDDALFFESRGDLWRGDGKETRNLTEGFPDPAQPGEEAEPGVVPAAVLRFADVLGVAGDRVFFSWDDPASGRELWSTDGTVTGTGLLYEASPGPDAGFPADADHRGVEAGPLFYFVTEDGGPGYELRRTDGTPAGTVLVRTFSSDQGDDAGSNVDGMAGTPSGRLYLVHRGASAEEGVDELWVSGGTASSTRLVRGLPGSFCGTEVVAVGEIGLFWVCEESTGGEAGRLHRLWRTDGTQGGTHPVAGTARPGRAPVLRVVGRRAYFQTRSPKELWISDGSPRGTRVLASLGGEQAVFDMHSLTPAGSRLFVAGDDGTHGYEPFALRPGRFLAGRAGPAPEGARARRLLRRSRATSGGKTAAHAP